MAIDPLSQTTRLAKRNLLAVSIVAIVVRTFDVSIDKLPFGGATFNFSEQAFSFLILGMIAYFSFTFACYYWIDIKDSETPEYQKSVKGSRNNDLSAYHEKFTDKAHEIIYEDEVFGIDYESIKEIIFSYRTLRPVKVEDLEVISYSTFLASTRNAKNLRHMTDGERKHADQVILRCARQYRVAYWSYWFWRTSKWICVEAIYAVRNYGLDGFLPIGLAVLAVACMYGLDLSGIADYLPAPKARH